MNQDGPVVREAVNSDLDRVIALHQSFNMVKREDPQRTRERWEWIWDRSPALALGRGPLAKGWVLESGLEIVGFFGNFAARYHFAGRDLLAAASSGWAVKKEFRTHTNLLATAYFGQKGPDIIISSTNNWPAGRIYERFSGRPMPQASYGQVMFWVLDAAGFGRAVLHLRGLGPVLFLAAAPALTLVLKAARPWKSRRPGRSVPGTTPEIIPLQAVGPEFNELWERKTAEDGRFLAYRRAEDIKWHFHFGDQAGLVTIIGCRGGGRLDGYLVLKREDAAASGLARLKIADLFVAGDDPSVVDVLLGAAYDAAREQGAHVLELIGLPQSLRARAQLSRPFLRPYPTFPFHYRPNAVALDEALLPENAWYPGPYDGDSSL